MTFFSTKTVMSKHFDWLRSIGMICNQSKTELMVYGKDLIKIHLNGEEITSKKTIKVLGLLFDNDLNGIHRLRRL